MTCDLDRSRRIAQGDEDDPAMLPLVVSPSGERDRAARQRGREFRDIVGFPEGFEWFLCQNYPTWSCTRLTPVRSVLIGFREAIPYVLQHLLGDVLEGRRHVKVILRARLKVGFEPLLLSEFDDLFAVD